MVRWVTFLYALRQCSEACNCNMLSELFMYILSYCTVLSPVLCMAVTLVEYFCLQHFQVLSDFITSTGGVC